MTRWAYMFHHNCAPKSQALQDIKTLTYQESSRKIMLHFRLHRLVLEPIWLTIFGKCKHNITNVAYNIW